MKRTSKKQQKFAAPGVAGQRVVVGGPEPPSSVRDARVGGVNAEYSAHGKGVAEDEERRRRGGRADDKGRGRRNRTTSGGEECESLSFYRPEGECVI